MIELVFRERFGCEYACVQNIPIYVRWPALCAILLQIYLLRSPLKLSVFKKIFEPFFIVLFQVSL